jgi:hypothetical protein
MRELSAVLKVLASARFEPGRNREYRTVRSGWPLSLFHQSQRALQRYTSSQSSAGNFAASLLTNGGVLSGSYN